MKLMLNGAVTVGTLDGANVEIRDAVGADNFFLCGLNVDEIEVARRDYDPQSIIDSDPDLLRVMRLLTSSHFNRFEPGIHDNIIEAIRNPLDQKRPCGSNSQRYRLHHPCRQETDVPWAYLVIGVAKGCT